MGLKEREEKRKSSVVGSMLAGSTGSEESGTKQKEKKDKKQLIQRGYYLEPVTAQAVKERAVREAKKDYEVVEMALQIFLKNEIADIEKRNN